MIDPQVEHGGASSWFWIAANFDATGLPTVAPVCGAEVGAAEAGAAEEVAPFAVP